MKFSKIQLGTVQFGLDYGIANTSGKPSYESVRDIISAAVSGGINTLDTAAAYGDSEVIIGKVLTELNLHDRVRIISKIPPLSVGNIDAAEAEKFITGSVENSLRRLQRDYLDVCLFHREEDLIYIDILRKLEARGLIRGCGVSLDSAEYCEQALNRKIEFIQLPYNILDKRFDAFFSEAMARNVKIFTRSLYLQGLLLMPEDRINPGISEVIPVRRKLEQLAKSAGMSMAQLCAGFVLSNPAVTSILTGVDSLAQLQENIALISQGALPMELLRQIKEIVPVFSESVIRPSRWKIA